jgi:hypothetical protein
VILAAVVAPARHGWEPITARISVLPARQALMTLWESPSWAFPRASRIHSLIGARPWLAGCPAVPSAWTDASLPWALPSSRALPGWRMRDAELSAY